MATVQNVEFLTGKYNAIVTYISENCLLIIHSIFVEELYASLTSACKFLF
jgi:hypothetical protein